MLLDIHSVNDVHFTGKDVIYIVSLLVTLLSALERTKKKYGLACLCIGGGEASAMVIERMN